MSLIYYFSGAAYGHIKNELNVDQLFTAYHERNLVRKMIQYKKEHPEHTGKLCLDCGAFSLYQKSKKEGDLDIDYISYMDDYLEFIEEVGDYMEWIAAVDVIPDPSKMRYDVAEETWNNYLYMVERISPRLRDKLIPLFHYGEDFKWLRNMLEYRHSDGTPIKYIGLAISLEGTPKIRIEWGRKCFQIISESSNPNVKTHGFGVGVKSVCQQLALTSTDATSYVKLAAYGGIYINGKTVHVSDVMRDRGDSRYFENLGESYKQEVLDIIKKRGFTLEELQENSEARVKFNIIDTLEWVKEFNTVNDFKKHKVNLWGDV